jgi:DNA repair protein RecN (Recombination protein N)
MLKNLQIDNVVLIESGEIDLSNFDCGLCVLSGETGSGKSILLDSFGLAIGFRSNLRLIGVNKDKATVNAEFSIKNNNIVKEILKENALINEEDENILKIRRIIDKNSSSKVFVNDQNIGVNLLAKIGENLVEIHGQHDQRGLLDPACHEIILDEFAKNQDLLKSVKKTYEEIRQIENQINDFEQKKEQIKREEDYLTYIIKELESANIKEGEEEELSQKKEKLIGLEKILNFLNDLNENLNEGNSKLILAQRAISRNQNIINNFLGEEKDFFEKINTQIDSQNAEIEENLRQISIFERDLKDNDDNLEEIEERLFQIKALSRKFNTTSNELAKIVEDARQKLDTIEKQEEIASDFIEKKEALSKIYQEDAQKLSQKRKIAAQKLSKKVEEELQFLKMENVKFIVEITNNPEFSASGIDKIRFFSAINKNQADDISKIASGGELSRFMLALKVALMEINSVPTIIFDEIDTGIGGSVANAVGERLKELSKKLQIFVVTHQPQIASKSTVHFKISKSLINEKVNTKIEKLNEENKIKEIARMLSGENITQEALAAAKKLI